MIILSLIFAIDPGNLAGESNEIPVLRGLEDIFRDTVSLAIPIAGIVLFVMLLIGGFKYITSGPDPQKVQSAKNTLTYAILGMVLFAMAYLIIAAIGHFTGAETYLKNFLIFID